MSRITALWDRLMTTKVGRAWDRYGKVRGNVLAGGIAYFAFFSLFPALAIGFTVYGLVMNGRVDLQRQVVDYVNTTFGGATVIGSTPGTGLVSIDRLVQGDVLTVAGLGGMVLLLFTGMGWVGALRAGISTVFGRSGPANPLTAKLGDLVILIGVGVAALASIAGSVLVTAATGPVLDWLGLGRSQAGGVLVSVLSSLVLLVIDTVLFLLLFRTLAGIRLPLDDLFIAAVAGGVTLGLLKVSGGVLLRYASHNRFLAASSLLVGLLLWMNLIARITLLAASWAATSAADAGHLPPTPLATGIPSAGAGTAPAGAGTDPGGVGTASGGVGTASGGAGTASGGAGVASGGGGIASGGGQAAPSGRGTGGRLVRVGTVGSPTYGVRAADRTTLLAGAVLGAVALAGVRVVGRAGGTVRELVRGSEAPR